MLGEGPPEAIAQRLRRQAAEFAERQPALRVIPAFHIISAVAQNRPQADGSYLIRMEDDEIETYIEVARQNGFLVFLDLQIGRSNVESEIERVRRHLADPIVHLAIDPEFVMAPGYVPGVTIGSLDGDQINVAQRMLDAIVLEHHLPNKILIVHQFREGMITGKQKVRDFPGVDLVYDADGFGDQPGKLSIYDQLIATPYTRFAAIKLFYKHDSGLFTPAQVLSLDPLPSIVIYQ